MKSDWLDSPWKFAIVFLGFYGLCLAVASILFHYRVFDHWSWW